MTKALYVVLRVDRSPTWFAGYAADGKTTVTDDIYKAAMIPLDDANRALYDLKIERPGVWSVRKVEIM